MSAKKEQGKPEEEVKPRRRVKKVKGHGGHHGGAWKVAYADFVTAMMALFLVLWLVSQADVKLKQSIANYFRSPGVFDSMKGGILEGPSKVSKSPVNLTEKDDEQALYAVADSIQSKFKDRPDFGRFKDRIQVKVTEEGLKIEILDKADQVSFESGSSEMNADAMEILKEIARAVCELPNPILIGGHTDARPFNGEGGRSNWELSTERANAARRILEGECVEPTQIQRIIGFAATDSIIPNDPYAPQNRRISITVLKMNSPLAMAVEDMKDWAKGNARDRKNAKPEDEAANGETQANIEEKPNAEAQPSQKQVPETAPKQNKKPPAPKKGESIQVGEPDEIPDKPRIKGNQ